MENNFLVSVRCISYNHAPYIKDCMNGFTMQETNFPYVCVIDDDASTDGEPEVINNYLAENFNLDDEDVVRKEETDDYHMIFAQHKTNKNCFFAVYFLNYNHYSIKKSRDKYVAKYINGAKYMAICEGDDYWIDPLKLQKQVVFMENHHDYTMCFHMVDIKVEHGVQRVDYFTKLEDREYTPQEIIKKWIVPTCSIFLLTSVFNKQPLNNHFVFGDDVIYATCLLYGKVYGMSRKMGVYRLVPTGWMATHSGKKRLYSSISQRKGLMEEFSFYRCNTNYQYMENTYFQLMYILVTEGNIRELRQVRKDYMQTLPQTSFVRFLIYCIRRNLQPIKRFIKQVFTNNI